VLTYGALHSRGALGTLNRHVIMVRIIYAEEKINGRLHADLEIDSKSLESSQPSLRLFQHSPIFPTSADLSLIGPPYTGTHPGTISKQTRTSSL
jgi:hypothetical protein